MFLGNFWKKKKDGTEEEEVWFAVSKESFDNMEEWAREEGVTVEDVMSKSILMYEVARHFRKKGLNLAAINDDWEVKAKLTIPGVTTLEEDPSHRADKPRKVT